MDTPCITHPGKLRADGYGQLKIGGRSGKLWYAHRWAYTQAKGAIPDGFQIDHLCRNRGCINPAHLEAVPQRVNIERGVSPSAITVRTGVCQRGHKMEGDNVITIAASGKRRCRECDRARDRDRYQRDRAKRIAAVAERRKKNREVKGESDI